MRCAECWADLAPGDRHCGRCGAPAPLDESGGDTIKLARGVPVAQQFPSTYGPPVLSEISLDGQETMTSGPARKQILGYQPFIPPPPPPKPRRWLWLRVASVAAVLLLLGIVATDLAAHGRMGFAALGDRPAATTTATQANTCVAKAVQANAAQALAHVQLTSGLKDAATKDFRPIDSIDSVTVGKDVYLTFQIATTSAGIVAVTFCTPGEKVEGTLAVPAKSTGRYAEFSARFAKADVGNCVATVTWNGAVVANKPFVIRQ